MILLDTNVVVALVDERDRLHARAKRDLGKLRGPFGITSVVLSEVCFLLEETYLRQRVRLLLARLAVTPVEPEPPWWEEVFEWLVRYAEHTPDLCDAMLVILSNKAGWPVWTYDTEFRKIWRGLDGRMVRALPDKR